MDEHMFKSQYPDVEIPTGNFITNLSRDWYKWPNMTALVRFANGLIVGRHWVRTKRQ